MKSISVIVPVKNEEKYLEQCLNSIINCNYPDKLYEIIVVDGNSTDGSVKIVKQFQKKNNNIRLFKNPNKITPAAFNIGIKAAKGDFVAIISAHGYIERDFLKNGIDCLIKKPEIDMVGGPVISTANNFFGNLVAVVTNSKFGTGSCFRYSRVEQYIDTVPFPIIRKKVFEKIGFYNEKLIRNQDNEFNCRLRQSGSKIYFSNNIISYVYVRSSLLQIVKYNFNSGKWNVYTNRMFSYTFALRHFIPLIFVLSFILCLGLSIFTIIGKILFGFLMICYLILSLFFSFKISLKKGIKYFLFLPGIYFIYHFSYGMGTLWAFLIRNKIPELR